MADSEKDIPISPATRFRIGSITKQFTATAILMEQALGTLSVDGLICEHVAHCPPAWAAVTIRHLLTHTSGIPELTELPEFDGTENVPTTPARTMALFADEPLEFAPGDQFSYTNSGSVLLGIILEHTSGITYEEYVESRILVPLGMADSGYEHDGDGVAVGYAKDDGPAQDIDMSVPYAFGALYSTVEDLHRWERAAAGGRLVPATALTDGAIGAPPADWEKAMTYGFGVIITESRDHRLVGHSGEINGFAAYYATYPDDDFSVVILSNREDWGILGLADAIEGMLFSG